MRSTTRPAGRVGEQPQRQHGQDAADGCRGGRAGGAAGPGREFGPKIVRKGQTRLEGFNERIIALVCAQGMTTRDIRAHLREMYDVDVSRPI